MARTTIRTEDVTDSEVTTAKMATDPTDASTLASGTVPTARLGSGTASSSTFLTGAQTYAAVDTSGIIANQDDIALLGFKVAANGSLARYNLVDQSIDAFEDASGVDASASSNEIRNASNYYEGLGPVTATGGTVTTDGDYSIHSITATGSTNYVTDTAQTIDYLIVGGGGGGGGFVAAGGGAGGYRSFTGVSLAAGTFAAVVGAGGAGGTGGYPGGTVGVSGGVSSFNSLTSAGGGGGGTYDSGSGGSGGSGGGGGGTGGSGGAGNTPSTSPSQGFAGGNGGGTNCRGGGGGGASEVGANSTVGNGGEGGDGTSNSITGSAVYYAGGGGGGSDSVEKAGGQGGGGAGGSESPGVAPVAGTDGKGGGGGGSRPRTGTTEAGADGGNGIVIIRRPTLGAEGGDMTLISNAQTAEAAPTNGDLVMTISNGAGTTTVNTDIKAYITRDGSDYTTAVTLVDQGDTGGHTILTANGVDLSGETSGTSMRWKITTHNQSASKTTRIQAVSLGWS